MRTARGTMSRVSQEYMETRAAAIRDAAKALFSRQGVDGTTMQEIATAAGISPGAIYNYYENKQSLLQAVFACCVEENYALFTGIAAETNSPLEALTQIGRLVWDDLKNPESRGHFMMQLEMSLATARDPKALAQTRGEFHESIVTMIADLVRRAQEADEVAPDVDPDALAVFLIAIVNGLRLFVAESATGTDTDAVFDLLLRMMTALSRDTAGK